MEILLINGPNLNLLGSRENSIYGSDTLEDIEKNLSVICKENDVSFTSFQSNAEHEIVEKIHAAKEDNVSKILMNPGAFTHTSISIRDALIVWAFRFMKSIFQIYLLEKNLDINHIFLILQRVLYVEWVLRAMNLP